MTRAPQPKWPVTAYPAVYYLVGTRWRLLLVEDIPYAAYAPGKKNLQSMTLPVAKRAVCRTGSLDGGTTAWIYCVHADWGDAGDVWLAPQRVRRRSGPGFRGKLIAPPYLIGEADLYPATMKVASH